MAERDRRDIVMEVMGGVATFMAMAYIIFVNPAILSEAGIPFQDALVATCLAAGMATLAMGLYADYPLALASGMGLNAVLVYTVVKGQGLSWQVGMGVVVLEGLLVTALVLTGLREKVMEAIPLSIKRAIGVGIGLFIAFIGLKNGGFVAAHPATLVTFGDFASRPVGVATAGLLLTGWMLARRVSGAILWGMLATAALAVFAGVAKRPEAWLAAPHLPSTLFQADLAGACRLSLLPLVFAFFMVDFFDTMGTVIAVGGQGGFLRPDGSLPRLNRVLLVDSLAAVIGGAFGASSVTTYIESAAGVAQGARTGLASVVTAVCFFAAIFLAPVGSVIATPAATAPALILVGFLMMSVVREIDWGNVEEGLPAFLTILLMPLTFSIARGIGAGLISYAALKLLRGHGRQVPPLLYITAALFLASFLLPG